MSDLPWFPFWVDDFRLSRGVRRMSMEAVGLYILVLCELWDGGPLPDDVRAVADLLGRPIESVQGPWEEVRRELKITKNGLVSPRLLRERQYQEDHRERRRRAGKRGAQVRWRQQLDGTAIGSANAIAMRHQWHPEPEPDPDLDLASESGFFDSDRDGRNPHDFAGDSDDDPAPSGGEP